MVATLSSVAVQAMLHEYYRGPIQDQLNRELLAVDMLKKGSFTWSGKNVIIPIRVGRNTGVGHRGEAGTTTGTLPIAGQQLRDRVISNATFLYGRFEITGPTISSAKKGGMHSFVNALDDEMTMLVDDVKDHANLLFFTGNECKGLLNEKKAQGAKPAAATTFNAGGTGPANAGETWWEYDGHFYPFDGTWIDPATNLAAAAVANASPETWVRVRLIRLDTYAEIVPSGNDAGIFVSDFDVAGGRVRLAAVNSDLAPGSLFSTAGVDLGVPVALCIHQTRLTDGVGFFGTFRNVSHEPHGILQNLCDRDFFNHVREDGTANQLEEMQSVCRTHNPTGTNARNTYNPDRMQVLLDDINLESGKKPKCWLLHTTTRQIYIANSQTVVVAGGGVAARIQKTASASSASGMDAGWNDEDLSYGGLPFKTSRHCPRGMFIAFDKEVWNLAELEAGDFADLDGAILSRVANEDAWEGFWRWYYQIVCKKPNRNGIIHGFARA